MKPARSKQRVLCLWLPNWPIQRLRGTHPELKGQPLVLYEEYRTGSFRLVKCSYLAQKLGVYPGMSLTEATSLAPLRTRLYTPAEDRQELAHLADFCTQFSPTVGLEEGDTPECVLLEVSGTAELFGGETALAERVHRTIQQQGYLGRVAIADTIGAAWGLARYTEVPWQVVPSGLTQHAMEPLPLEALRLPTDMCELLTELGIHQVGQLLQLDRAALAARFNPQLLLRVQQALGEVAEPIHAQHTLPEIEASLSLEHPTERLEDVQQIVRQLLEPVLGELHQRQQGVLQLKCELQCEVGDTLRLSVGLYQATSVREHLLELIAMQLGQTRIPSRIVKVGLAVISAAKLQPQQQELFAQGSQREHQRELGQLVDRLSSRLGQEAVVRPKLLADAQPEYAYRYQPLAGTNPKKRSNPHPRRGEAKFRPGQRPLRIEPRPLPLQVTSVVPYGPPIQFHLQGEQHRVSQSWGPERIQTGWWRGQHIRRDYYRVETSQGRRYWLYRRLPDGDWFLHGTF